GKAQKLRSSKVSRSGSRSARLSTKRTRTVVLNDRKNSARTSKRNERSRVPARVRTNRPNVRGQGRVRAVTYGKVQRLSTSCGLTDRSWTKVQFEGTVRRAGASLDVNVLAWKLRKGSRLFIDDVALQRLTTTTVAKREFPSAPKDPVGGSLTNGCDYTTRGIPSCGAYVGGAYKSNTDPREWEASLSKQLGIRRTYYGPTQVTGAVSKAKDDIANRRIPWLSFKAPHSWGEMAAGRGDAWAKDLAKRLAALDGPVWVAVHHEPENDGGDITEWTAMQARLAPIFRSAGDHVAFSLVLTGYQQFYGDKKYRLDSLWPKNTAVDIAGFPLYDDYGM